MLLQTSLTVLGLSLSTFTHARTLSKKSVTWNECPEFNKNVSEVNLNAGPFTPFECGTLSVPLDYTLDDSPPLELNLLRVKATKEPVLGTVLFNPGGPGGNAVDSFPRAATDLRNIVGEQHHLVSWDPRGTGRTIPYNGTAAGAAGGAGLQKRDDFLASINMTEFFLTTGWDLSLLSAEAVVPDNKETGSLIGTVFTARDMLKIVDATSEDGMLRYYGWSYGTVLGHYFATLFPDRVERMVLDANLDPADYRDGHWGDSLLDTDKALMAFLENCYENKEECPLVEFLGATSAQDLFDGLNLAASATAANVTATDLTSFTNHVLPKGEIRTALYFPSRWPQLAKTLVQNLNGTASPPRPPPKWVWEQAVDAIGGIRASDATFKPTSAEEYLPQVEFQAKLSGFSDSFYPFVWTSARWKMPAKERYYGKFEAKTKHPILYVNGEYDPVCPLEAARRASKGFEGSVVLSHSGYGHGLIASPSTCAQEHTRAYFAEGVLPEANTTCEPDLGPWELSKARNGTQMGAIRHLSVARKARLGQTVHNWYIVSDRR